MDNRAIGVFDSGYGGLTAVRALRALLPDENIIYFGDSARAPYGPRPVKQLRIMAQQDMELLLQRDVKAILAACGTVSSNAADILEEFPVKVIGVLKASVKFMSELSGDEPLAVIATEASINSGAFQNELERLCPDREIIALPCPEFVPLIESGHYLPDDPQVIDAVERSLKPLKDKNPRALLLGCTHFGLISEAIGNYLGKVELVSASRCAALQMRDYIAENELCGKGGTLNCLTSGQAREFEQSAPIFLGQRDNVQVEQLPVMEV